MLYLEIDEMFIYVLDMLCIYSASRCATGATSSTWIPPLFFSSLSWNGSFHPPSLSGVANHNRIRCRRGAGGA